MHTFFSRGEQFSGIITFPESNITAKGKPWGKVLNTLQKWCKTSKSDDAYCNKDDATGLIIRNFDLKDYLDFCNVSNNEKKDHLPLLLKDFEYNFKLQKNDNRFLVFNPAEKILLVIRMVEGQQNGELKNGAYLCIDEVNIVCFLLRDELRDSGVIVTGLVTYSGYNPHCESYCRNCGNFIVTSRIFDSVEAFDMFWRMLVKEHVFEGLAQLLRTRQNMNTVEVFKAIGSKLLGYLAHVQFSTLEEPVLPVTKNNPSENIIQAELLLDRYQMEIAYSDEKRILLHGDYGVGKTVVALKKVELLYKNLTNEEVIYYINSAGKSRFDYMVMQKFKTYEKVRVLRGGSSLSHIVTNKILPKEDKNNTRNIHLLVDEYDSQDLSPEESASLYQIFTETEQFKNSTLLIALQPIRIDRVDYFYGGGKKQRYLQKMHAFEKLRTIMTEYQLNYVMRTTIEINTLIEITQNYLNRKSNSYIHWHQPGKISSSPKGINQEKFSSKMEKMKSESSLDHSLFPIDFNDDGGLVFENIKPEFSSLESAPVTSSLSIVASNVSSSSATSQFSSTALIDYDELYKLTGKPIKGDEANLPKTVTKYSYTCSSEIGHSIHGLLPFLIELRRKLYKISEVIALIAFLLKEIIHIGKKRIAILHFEPTNAPWLQQLLQLESCFKSLTLTHEVEKFLTNTGDNVVLVSRYDTVRGLEFSDVLLILEQDEYYLKHYIPEAIARCRSNLLVLVKPPWKKRNQSNTVEHLVHHWKKINDAKILKEKKPLLRLLKLGFCTEDTCKILSKESACSSSPGNRSFYGLHKHTKWYKGLHKEIKEKIVPNLQLDNKKREEEAATL